jgi:CheY-like chemotaxis protein
MEYRILLVDDSDMQRYAIAKTLTSAGFQVLEAQNGTEAL